jgi:hypothetical protein
VRVKKAKSRYTYAAFSLVLIILVGVLSTVSSFIASAQVGEFSLQVTPSPLVATVKPGQVSDLEIRIRNAGSQPENLKIEARKFVVNRQTGDVTFDDTAVPEIAPWITFGAPRFTIKPGEWYTQKVRISLPKDTGFSYSLALVISRSDNQKSVESGRLIKGSVAVFTLINVDRPGATRKLEVSEFKTSQTVYEFLPAEFTVTFKNTGNTITQPYGNIFIQRGSNDTDPTAVLPVNDKGGYLLPGTPRELTSSWDEGFPIFKKSTQLDGSEKNELTWDWSTISDFRIGQYTAKLIGIYNDGERDIPIEREVTFWVLPWRSFLLITAVIGLVAFIRHKQIKRKTRKAVQKALNERDKKQEKSDEK